jgi:hypothetical protein
MRAAAALIFFVGVGSGSVVTRAMVAPTAPQSKESGEVGDTSRAGTPSAASPKFASSAEELVRYLNDPANSVQRDLVLRLSALEGVVTTTELAVREAPGDLALAAYHAAALRRRALLWQQVAQGSGERWY